MHPATAFRWEDHDELRAFVQEHAFATIVAAIDGRLAVAHAPLIVDGERCLLHLSRGNAIAKALPTAATAIVTGDHAYVSPDWYAEVDQVPTWNYESVELMGSLAPTDGELLHEILVRESAIFEERIANKRPWTIDKLAPATLAAKLKGIVGVTFDVHELRGTQKLSQNKPAADRDGVIEALGVSPVERERRVAARMRAVIRTRTA
jgi:transcriptional regulator